MALSPKAVKTITDTVSKAVKKASEKVAREEKKPALPLDLVRAKPKTKQEIIDIADRVARQQSGEFIRKSELSGKADDTANLAGRSAKEVRRLKDVDYTLERTKDIRPTPTYESEVGDLNIAIPGDQTIADFNLVDVNGRPIGSVQQGGSLYGEGKLDLDDPLFWASEEGIAQILQDKITKLAQLYNTDRVTAYHLAMGQDANNFAMHFADANLKAIANSDLSPEAIEIFNEAVRQGPRHPKTGVRIPMPHFAGIENPELAYQQMLENPMLRKWFNDRMKVDKYTTKVGLPSGKDIQWAITEPALRDMEISLTGHSVGRMKPFAELTDTADHVTYGKGIQGESLGRAPELAPFEMAFPDADLYLRSVYDPSDLTGTIQKVFPHQKVDQQQLDQMSEYYRRLREIRGFKKGGKVDLEAEFRKADMIAPQHFGDGGEAEKPQRKIELEEYIQQENLNTLLQELAKRIQLSGEMAQSREGKQAFGRLGYRQPIGDDMSVGVGASGHYFKGDRFKNADVDRADMSLSKRFKDESELRARLGANLNEQMGKRGLDELMLEYEIPFKDGGKAKKKSKGYGERIDGTEKERGFLGEIRMPDGRDVMTEVSVGMPNTDELFRPSIISGMHPADLNYLRETGIVPEDLYQASLLHAQKRIKEGKSPFWNAKEDAESQNFGGGGLARGAKKIAETAKKATAKALERQKTEYELAHELAQKRAALPVEEGGLGLPPDNTAMDRARALGFDVDNLLYHGTSSDIKELRTPKSLYEGFYTTRDPNYASMFATERGIDRENPLVLEGGNVLPLIGREVKNPYPIYGDKSPLSDEAKDFYMREFIRRYPSAPSMEKGQSFKDYLKTAGREADYLQSKRDYLDSGNFFDFPDNFEAQKKALELSGYGGIGAGQHKVYLNPSDVRSKFAAFDPFKRNESDILAGLMALPAIELLGDDKKPSKSDKKKVKGYKDGGDLEEEFRKADMIDMSGFRQDPLEKATRRADNKPKKQSSMSELNKRLNIAKEVGAELADEFKKSSAKEVKAATRSPKGAVDLLRNIASQYAAMAEDSPIIPTLTGSSQNELAKLALTAMKGKKALEQEYANRKPSDLMGKELSAYDMKTMGDGMLSRAIMGDAEPMPILSTIVDFASPFAAKSIAKGAKAIAPDVMRAIEKATVDPYKMYAVKPEGGQWLPKKLNKELEDISMVQSGGDINKAINAWVSGPLRKYIVNRLGTKNDEILKLYDEGVKHVPEDVLRVSSRREDLPYLRTRSADTGYVAKSDAGKKWENAADTAVNIRTPNQIGEFIKEQNAWINKLDPEEKVYSLHSNPEYGSSVLRNLGLDHLVDILKADLRSGALRPEQLNKVSVEDAVKRAHKYNVEREKIAKEKSLFELQDFLPTHREYPEGYKWVELKYPEGDKKRLNEIDTILYSNRIGGEWKPRQYGSGEIYLYKEDPYIKVQGVPANQTLVDSSGRPKFFSSLEEAEAEANNLNSKGNLSQSEIELLQKERDKLTKEYAKNKTQEALTYEGDTMVHCVGGYCNEVMSGDKRIFSLRDAKGKPHATIEVTDVNAPAFYEMNKKFFEANPKLNEYVQHMNDVSDSEGDFVRKVSQRMKEMGIEPLIPEQNFKIEQIKGKSNAKPSQEVIPYVQDFVKNPVVGKEWTDVGDFYNTDFINANLLRKEGVMPDVDTEAMNTVLQELDRIYPMNKLPGGQREFVGEYGELLPTSDMLKAQIQDLTSPYLTKEDIINHLRSKEALPVEQSYSKYYENLPKDEGMAHGGDVHMAKGGFMGAVETAGKLGREGLRRFNDKLNKLSRNVAYNTYEQVPYTGAKHLEGMPGKSFESKLLFTEEAPWGSPEKDADLLAKYLGLESGPSQKGVGLYQPPIEGAPLEFNPQISSRTLVKSDKGRYNENLIAEPDKASMTALGATRGYLDVQGASPWVRPSQGSGRLYNGFHISLNGKPTEEEMRKIGEIQANYGFWGAGDLGKSGVYVGFNPEMTRDDLNKMQRAFRKDIKEALGDRVAGVKMMKSEGDYPAFEEAWKAPQGTGTVTRQLMEYLDTAKEKNPLLAEYYAQKPSTELQKLMQEMNIRDIKAPEKYGVGAPREDVMKARDIFAEYGIEGLRDALNRGEYLPAAVAIPSGIELFRDDN